MSGWVSRVTVGVRCAAHGPRVARSKHPPDAACLAPAPLSPALSRKGRGSFVARTVEGHARLRGRIPAERGPCSALQRALSHKGRGCFCRPHGPGLRAPSRSHPRQAGPLLRAPARPLPRGGSRRPHGRGPRGEGGVRSRGAGRVTRLASLISRHTNSCSDRPADPSSATASWRAASRPRSRSDARGRCGAGRSAWSRRLGSPA